MLRGVTVNCKNCEAEIEDGTTICPTCGADQRRVDKGGMLPQTKRYLFRQLVLVPVAG